MSLKPKDTIPKREEKTRTPQGQDGDVVRKDQNGNFKERKPEVSETRPRPTKSKES